MNKITNLISWFIVDRTIGCITKVKVKINHRKDDTGLVEEVNDIWESVIETLPEEAGVKVGNLQ